MSDTPVHITYLGHATLLIEMDGVRVLTDPLLRTRVAHLHRLVPLETACLGKFGDIKAVLVSHLHFDHFDLPTLQMFDRRATLVVPRGGAVSLLRRRGFTDVRGVEPGSLTSLGSVTVQAVHAQHPGSRGTPWLKGPAVGYVIRGSKSIYFAGDTGPFSGMSDLRGMDVALLPVAGWGSRLQEGDHMNAAQAAQVLKILAPRIAIPIHWGTFAPVWPGHAIPANQSAGGEFQRQAAALAPAVDVHVLNPGATLTLPASHDDGPASHSMCRT